MIYPDWLGTYSGTGGGDYSYLADKMLVFEVGAAEVVFDMATAEMSFSAEPAEVEFSASPSEIIFDTAPNDYQFDITIPTIGV